MLLVVFFFFKQKTAYEMRISDWSSDVCSSDLAWEKAARAPVPPAHALHGPGRRLLQCQDYWQLPLPPAPKGPGRQIAATMQCRSAPCPSGRSARRGRSEERRVGKGGVRMGRSRWQSHHSKKKTINEQKR